MNKIVIATLLLTAVMTGCSSDAYAPEENSSQEQSEQVLATFQVTAAQTDTRGVPVKNTEDFATGGREFKLWGWMTKPGDATPYPMNSDFNSQPLSGATVTYSADDKEWNTDVQYYWPRPTYRADFYALYPASLTLDSDRTLNYTVSQTVTASQNEDVMYATYSDTRDQKVFLEGARTAYLKFYHALSQIHFSGILSNDFATKFQYNIEVKSITICNVNSKAKLTLDASVNGLKETGKKEALKISDLNTPVDYSPVMNNKTGDINPVVNTTKSASGESNPVDLTSSNNFLMVLPQELTAWDPNTEKVTATSNCYLKLELRVKDRITDAVVYPVTGTEPITPYITSYVPFDTKTTVDGNAWKPGRSYHYTLEFGIGYSEDGNPFIKPITISAAIKPWDTVTVDGTVKRH